MRSLSSEFLCSRESCSRLKKTCHLKDPLSWKRDPLSWNSRLRCCLSSGGKSTEPTERRTVFCQDRAGGSDFFSPGLLETSSLSYDLLGKPINLRSLILGSDIQSRVRKKSNCLIEYITPRKATLSEREGAGTFLEFWCYNSSLLTV